MIPLSERQQRYLFPLLLALSVAGGVLSCGGDANTAPAPRSAGQAYWALHLNQHAINLALTPPYDTVHLTATPVTVTGTPLTNAGGVTFQATDSNVTVDSNGVVTAHFVTPGQPTSVIATLTTQGVTLHDTAFIQVTETVPPAMLATFSMQPAPGDSAKRSIDSTDYMWPVTATDAAHDTICNVNACSIQVYYSSSDPLIARIDRQTGEVGANDTGHVVFTATTLAYGVAMQDSVRFTVGYKLSYNIDLALAMVLGVLTLTFGAPKKLILGVGAVVTFCNQSPQPVDIVFDNPAAVDSASCVVPGYAEGPPTGPGNITAFGGDTTRDYPSIPYSNLNDCRARRFLVPGVYRYHSSLFPSDTYEIDVKQQQ